MRLNRGPPSPISKNTTAMFLLYVLASFGFSFTVALQREENFSKPTHILLIVADDYGWSDVGYHGSVIQTPNLDQLSGDGVTLDNYYVQPFCTPTRSALMTGRYPIHTGMQHFVITSAQPYGLPTNVAILPQRLKEAGYQTHIVGKWNLGYFSEPYLPVKRGFDSFFGYYNGAEDYFTHRRLGFLDLRDGEKQATDYDGVYSAHAFVKVNVTSLRLS